MEQTPQVFITAWNQFVKDDPRGRDHAERVRSYLDERSCARTHTRLGAVLDNSWVDDPMRAGLALATNMIKIPEQHSRLLLRNPDDWYEQRLKVYNKYNNMGPTVIRDALHFIEKNRREGRARHPINAPKTPFYHPKKDLDADQRRVWLLAQMAMFDKLPKKDGKHKQLLLRVRGGGGCGKTRVIECLLNDPEFAARGRLHTPTGASAAHAGGTTYYASMILPVGESNVHALSGEAKRRVELRYPASVRLLMIDECGMQGQAITAWIDLRL